VPRELTITVTASPTKGLKPTLALTERLTAHGYAAVPHLSAPLVRDGAHLAEIVARLTVRASGARPPEGCQRRGWAPTATRTTADAQPRRWRQRGVGRRRCTLGGWGERG